MNKFKELKVWKKAIILVKKVYIATQTFPKEEIYSLTSQIRLASISIASNIAEGAGRVSTGDFKHFLNIARGSSFELETQLIIAYELNYVDQNNYNELLKRVDEIQRMITGLQKSLS